MKKLKILILLFIFSSSICFEVSAENLAEYNAIQLNNQGADFLKNQNYTAAQERFILGLAKAPFWPEVHINLGLSFYGLNQVEKAEASFNTALKLSNSDEIKFVALFNLAELNGKAKKVDIALNYYQQALQLNPSSIETKTNIELLIQDQQGGGQGENKDEDKDQQGKDNKDENKDSEGKDKKENEEQKESDKDKDKDKDKENDKPKQYGKNKPQPKQFKSENLTPGDVNKILGELRQQEQKIRAEFNKKTGKEKPRDKDW